MAVGPYHRVDLAILGLVFGTVFSILTFFFTRTRQLWQAVLLACIGLLNIGVLFIANQVWAPNMAASGKSTPLVPMLVIVLILLLSGPVLGLFRRPVKTIFGKFIK
jgi:peptidoglycan/LPS O-acetylase OafA/YrhL